MIFEFTTSMRRLVLAIILMSALNAWGTPPLCGDVFQFENSRTESKTLNPNFGISYQKSEQVTGIKSKSGYLRTFSHYHQTLEGEFIRTDLFDFFPSTAKANGDSKYLNLVEKNIEFVLNQYRQRREWTPEYLNAIRKDAFAFAERATYIVAHKQYSPILEGPGEIIGTMKVIAGDQTHKLPLEIDHSLQLPTNNGKKFEPGNFVVQKEESALAFGEVMSHFVRFAKELQKDPGHDPHQMIFFTDADRASSMMYKQLGFTAVPGYEKPLVKNGKEYFLIGASTNKVLEFPNIFSSKRSEWEKEGALEFFTRTPGRMPLEDIVMLFRNVSIKTDTDHIYTSEQLKTLTQKGLQFYLKNDETSGKTLILRRDYGLGKFYFNLSLKESELPLREGVIRAKSNDPEGTIEINYQNGILRVAHFNSKETTLLKIKTNKDFSDVQSVVYQEFESKKVTLEIKTQDIPNIRVFP